ncbi:hypothetical protein CHARACLAT_027241 [Characodon lateralis]|uniref:Uncharacterized protein n=1 Tax=Characodon lateralis TaxID=208331 RepID=A0ABU7DY63_9TELE|nr:hypothetical protein [Characodon lateralis]
MTLETKLYYFVAKMFIVCVVHGGVGAHFFSERLFQQICGLPTAPVRVEDLHDHKLWEQLLKIQEAETTEEANFAIQEAVDSLSIMLPYACLKARGKGLPGSLRCRVHCQRMYERCSRLVCRGL